MSTHAAARRLSARKKSFERIHFERRERRARLVLTLACVAAYAPAIVALLLGARPFDDDAVSLFGPWREWSRQSLERGVLPLWNPHLFCGLPFGSNGQASILYPPNVVYRLFSLPWAFTLDAVAHNIWFALGAFALARALGQSRTASLVASLAWALGGGVAAHIYTGHFTWHAARAYMPWQMLLTLLFLRGEKRFALALALLFTMQIAAGYPPLVLLAAALCAGVFIARTISHLMTSRQALRADATSGVMRHMSTHAAAWFSFRDLSRASSQLPRGWPAMVVGTALLTAALSLVWVLPLRETSVLSVHGSALSYSDAVEVSGSWRSLVRLVAPDFFGGNRWQQWSVSFGAWEEAAYGGLLALLLALGAPFFARRWMPDSDAKNPHHHHDSPCGPRMSTYGAAQSSLERCGRTTVENQQAVAFSRDLPRAVWWLWCLLPCSLLLALGDNTPFYRWLFDHIALLRLTRAPVRWLEVWMMAAALLAGFSFDALVHRAPVAKAVLTSAQSSTEAAAHAHFQQRRLKIVQIALAVLCGALGVLLAVCAFSSPSSRWWMQTAQWSQVLRASSATRAQNAIELREIAVLEAALAFIISAGFCALWSRLRRCFDGRSFNASENTSRKTLSSDARSDKRTRPRRNWRLAQALLVAAMALDVSALFWRSAKIVAPRRMSTQIRWPQSLVNRYKPHERWDSTVSWHSSNGNLPLGIDVFDGYDAMQSRRYSAFVQKMEGRTFWADLYQVQFRSPLERVAGVTHTLSQMRNRVPDVRAGESAPVLEARDGQWSLWRHARAWPRVYLSRRLIRAPDEHQLDVLERLAAMPFVASQAPVVIAPNAFAPNAFPPNAFAQLKLPHEYSYAEHLSLSRADRVKWRQEGNRVHIDVERNDGAPCVLIVSQSLYPGWRAWVNGRVVRLESANYLFGALPIPSGHSRIELVYDSQTFRFGGFVSLCALGLVAALVAFRCVAFRPT